jgi:S-adenosylmethionine:tRNA ribosyltransferase-isomerase
MASTQVPCRTSDFDYQLPAELVAQYPTERRGESRLLVVRRESGLGTRGSALLSHPGPRAPHPEPRFTDCQFADFPSLLHPGDVVVLNTTKVRHARLLAQRPSGRPVEVLLLHPDRDDSWIAMGKPGNALRPGKRVMLNAVVAIETLAILPEGYRRVRITGATAQDAMEQFGRLPLPPYIDRDPTPLDESRYQTVFAEREASVAAPTAGLHFTPELLAQVEPHGAVLARLELEVGPGTFRPVEDEDYRRHPMHEERFEIPEATAHAIAQARAAGGAVWAVGTTVVRALESAAAADGSVLPGPGSTRLMITPGYEFRIVDRLLTNFHLPRSTLLMLVAAFAGYQRIMDAYRHAIARRYRFYSYGDAMAILQGLGTGG